MFSFLHCSAFRPCSFCPETPEVDLEQIRYEDRLEATGGYVPVFFGRQYSNKSLKRKAEDAGCKPEEAMPKATAGATGSAPCWAPPDLSENWASSSVNVKVEAMQSAKATPQAMGGERLRPDLPHLPTSCPAIIPKGQGCAETNYSVKPEANLGCACEEMGVFEEP